MIVINCTSCQQRLEMDEAFAGGVCRCQHCGTIQTVPAHLKRSASPAAAGAKGLQTGAGGHEGSGLDDLADVVASSGLSRSSLSGKGRAPYRDGSGSLAAAHVDHAPAELQRKSPVGPALLGAGVVVMLLLGVIAYLVYSRGAGTSGVATDGTGQGPNTSGGGGSQNEEPEETLTIAGPAYADVPLTSGSVAYLVDRSQANTEVLDTLKASIYWSAFSLGPERKFQILFWHHNEEKIVAYPEEGLAPATREEINAAGRKFDNVIGYGNTDLRPTLEKAVESRPDAIVIVTAKGLYLEDETLAAVDEVLGGTAIKVHTFSLGESESPVLKQIAQKTGGRYRELTARQLDKLKYRIPER